MQKLSLSSLLRFLGRYSHWNLVRQSHCYNLYFIPRETESRRVSRRKCNNKTRAGYKTRKIATSTQKKRKDNIVFTPIIKGNVADDTKNNDNHENISGEVESTRRSSFSSFIWDDYLPSYQQESDDLAKQDNISEDSGKSTPVVDTLFEASVLKQGDRLLKEMLDLRKELEKDKVDLEKSVKSKSGLLPDYGPLDESEENMLREKLEMMTLQIKKEMEEEFKRQQSELEFGENEDDDSKIKKIFQHMISDDNSTLTESKSGNKEALQMAIKNLLLMNETPKTFEEAHKLFNTNQKKSKKKGTSKPTPKNPKEEAPAQTVEIPFCSHKIKTTSETLLEKPSSTTQSSVKNEESEQEEVTKLVLSGEEQKAANDILKELVEIRENGKQNSDPVLDTMISVIQLSSSNVSLPSPITRGASSGIHFKELFNFEVNFSESKEAFAKLTGVEKDKNVTIQELFPWTLNHSKNKQYEALKQ